MGDAPAATAGDSDDADGDFVLASLPVFRDASAEQQLDMGITWLRQVHHVCYYSGQRHALRGALHYSCGPIFLRASKAIWQNHQEAEQKLNKKIDNTLEEETGKSGKKLFHESLDERLK